MRHLAHRIAVSTAALFVLLLLLTGVPTLLVTTIGNPLPTGTLGMTTRLTDETLLGILAFGVWVMWLQFLGCVLLEAVAEVRLALGTSTHARDALPGTFPGQQRLARTLVHALVAGGIGAGTLAVPSLATPIAEATLPQEQDSPIEYVGKTSEHQGTSTRDVVVERGDTLWALAEQHLGAGERWREIAELNQGRTMADGSRFTDAGSLTPGWALLLPRDVNAPESAGAVVVESGDTLWGLADDAYGDGARWPRIYRGNQEQIEDPDLIYVGQVLEIPQTRSSRDPSPKPSTKPSTKPATPVQPRAPQTERHAGTETEAPPPAAPPPRADVDSEASAESSDASDSVRAELLVALGGAGALLGGGLFAALVAQRRRQYRTRRSGRVVARTPDDLVPVEAAVRAAGSAGLPDAEFLDQALRELVVLTRRAAGITLPDVLAAELTEESLGLLLGATPADRPPAPWGESREGLTLVRTRDTAITETDAHAPYPLLVSLGVDESGSTWLVDLEAAGITHLTGSPTEVEALARHLAAEVALNVWSDHVDVIATSEGRTLHALNPERARAVEPRALFDQLVQHVRDVVDSAQVTGHDVLRGRLDGGAAEAWMPTLAVVTGDQVGPHDVQRLRQETAWLRGRSATALVIVGGEERLAGAALHLDLRSDGWLAVEPLGLKLKPTGIVARPLERVAELVSYHQSADAEEPPASIAGPHGRAVNVVGALRDMAPRDSAGSPASLLPAPDEDYLSSAATTREDLEALAPLVDPVVGEQILAMDPELDTDLQDWHDPQCPRPRIRMLGPVELTVAVEPDGDARTRRAFATEIAAYLATHPHGATSEQIATEFDLKESVVHNYMTAARKWMGADPATGTAYLPDCTKTDAARRRGIGVYQLEGVLSDEDLFRRLRARAQARGAEGLGDLVSALKLVRGRPFDHLRRRGYGWLAETPLDHQLSAAIVDVAHLVSVRCLAEGDPETARWAAETAIAAAPDEEKPRLDLEAALGTSGGDRSGLGVDDLTDRGREVVDRRERRE